MANIESKNLLIALKAFSRANALPLDKDEVWESLHEAQAYTQSATAYAGQTIKVLREDGKYYSYILQPTINGLIMESQSGGVSPDTTKQYVQIVDSLPLENQIQGVIYINLSDDTGYIWTGTEFKSIFKNIEEDITNVYTKEEIDTKVNSILKDLQDKATVNYVDEQIVNIKDFFSEELQQAMDGIPEGTSIKNYIDTAIGAGGTDAAEAIAQAKADAIAYTDERMTIVGF